MGGEVTTLGKSNEYFWKKDLLKSIRQQGMGFEELI